MRESLEEAQHRISELDRERDLQNKALKVLHQQLALERPRSDALARAAST
ncbi:MAG: hypothetical protein QF921_12700 [Pseudomonadales bacterium]|nr:hypothetical protein [Pseudomonadales bacterium]MDP6471458.1 hypothetical protein [Pseudomonadales bacterium]MDP6828627.1 hypothetical protein [Pseudomonadales bacterium]MDP6972346.1 hypothetical protein [Pseudomonadales bacterium]